MPTTKPNPKKPTLIFTPKVAQKKPTIILTPKPQPDIQRGVPMSSLAAKTNKKKTA